MKNSKRQILLSVLLLQIVGVIYFFSSLCNFFPTLDLWVRIVIPALLFTGLVGGALGASRLLLVGKIGAWCFLLYVLATTIPDPDYYWARDLEIPGNQYVILRAGILWTVGLSILISLRLIGKSKPA